MADDAEGCDQAVSDLIGVLERSKSYDAYLALIRIIDEHPKALDADLMARAGRALLAHGWDQRLEHLLTRRVRGGGYLLGTTAVGRFAGTLRTEPSSLRYLQSRTSSRVDLERLCSSGRDLTESRRNHSH